MHLVRKVTRPEETYGNVAWSREGIDYATLVKNGAGSVVHNSRIDSGVAVALTEAWIMLTFVDVFFIEIGEDKIKTIRYLSNIIKGLPKIIFTVF